VPADLTAYHFNFIIRKRIKLPEKDSLYFFVGGKYMLKGGIDYSYLYIQFMVISIDTLMLTVYE
jgi:hypothetical protein